MNRGELRTLALSWLDDLAGTYFTESQMNVWLNNAQREVAKQLIQSGEQWYTTRASTGIGPNYTVYTLPEDFLRVDKLQILISGTVPNQNFQLLTPVTLVQLAQLSPPSIGTPSAYAIRKNYLVITPIPSQAYTIYMDYTYRVADMGSDTDIPDVPPQFQEYIAVLAAADGFLKDQRDPSMIMAKKEYYLQLMKQDSQNRNVDAPRMVVATDLSDVTFNF